MLYSEQTALIIDAGLGVRTLKKHLKAYGLKLPEQTALLITHDHTDHTKSAGSLSRDYELPVYATQKVHVGIERNWHVRHKIAPALAHIIERDQTFELNGFTITAFCVPHDASDNVGYCIQREGITFVLMTDVGHMTEELKTYIGCANYLVIEADYEEEMLRTGPYSEHLKRRIAGSLGHMSNVECGMALAENATQALRHVWLCHLSDENNHPELAEKTVKQILGAHGIVAGDSGNADFKLDTLKRKTPSGIFDLT